MTEAVPVEGSPPGRTSIRTASIVVGLVVMALIVLLAVGGGDPEGESSAVLGRRVPAIVGVPLEGLAGDSVDGAGNLVRYNIDARRGEWVLVNFFATWCPGCITEHPELVALERWGGDNRLSIVAVVFDDPDTGAIQAFFADQGGGWPVIDDPGAAIEFQIAQIPESFLVAPSGLVVEHYVGGLSATAVRQTIEELS